MATSPRTQYDTLIDYLKLARLHQPVGNWLFFWPFAWSALMAARQFSVPALSLVQPISLYAIGSVLLRSAACVWNDICDIDIDRAVERTKTRPLASGVLSRRGALAYLAALTAACMALLHFASDQAWYQGLFGLFVLNSLYPLMKRFTHWPQAWLGLAINWGFVVAWLEFSDQKIDTTFMTCVMLSMACWTIFYDSIYACQDMADDLRLGVKSTAILFGTWFRPIIAAFAASFIFLLAVAGSLNGQGALFFLVSVLGAAAHVTWQLYTLDTKNPSDCKSKFLSNVKLGWIVATGLALDNYVSL